MVPFRSAFSSEDCTHRVHKRPHSAHKHASVKFIGSHSTVDSGAAAAQYFGPLSNSDSQNQQMCLKVTEAQALSGNAAASSARNVDGSSGNSCNSERPGPWL